VGEKIKCKTNIGSSLQFFSPNALKYKYSRKRTVKSIGNGRLIKNYHYPEQTTKATGIFAQELRSPQYFLP